MTIGRHEIARRGRRLEYFTIAWNTLEGLIGVGAGLLAGSISLVGFGMDSFIEVTSGVTLLWRMSVDEDAERRERNEKLSLRIVGACFIGLAAYITYEAISDFDQENNAGAQHSWNRSGVCLSCRHADSVRRQKEGWQCPE